MTLRRLTRRLAGVISKGIRNLQLVKMTDNRDRRGRRHKRIQPAIVALITGLVCGRKGLAEVENLTQDLSAAARRLLGIKQRMSDTTLRNLVLTLNLDDLRDALRRGILALTPGHVALAPVGLPFGTVSMDGRGTSTNLWEADDPYAQIHHNKNHAYGLVRTVTSCLISSAARLCLDMHPIPANTNENGVFSEAFAQLVRYYSHLFRLVIYDSGANATANAQLVIDAGKDYLFRVQAEQPTIFNECVRLLGRKQLRTATCLGSTIHGGKVITRYLWLDERMVGWHDYPGLRCGLRLLSVSEDKVTGKVSEENRYYITSMTGSTLEAKVWGDLIRRHWSVENNCHNTWDKLLQEDKRPWLKLPRGMIRIMALRRIAYNILALYREAVRSEDDDGVGQGATTPWKRLMELMRDALLQLQPVDLCEPRPLEVLAFH